VCCELPFDSQEFANALRGVLGLSPLYGPMVKIICWQAWPLMEAVEEVMGLETLISEDHQKEFYKCQNVRIRRARFRRLY
jgi:hypothetical protein